MPSAGSTTCRCWAGCCCGAAAATAGRRSRSAIRWSRRPRPRCSCCWHCTRSFARRRQSAAVPPAVGGPRRASLDSGHLRLSLAAAVYAVGRGPDRLDGKRLPWRLFCRRWSSGGWRRWSGRGCIPCRPGPLRQTSLRPAGRRCCAGLAAGAILGGWAACLRRRRLPAATYWRRDALWASALVLGWQAAVVTASAVAVGSRCLRLAARWRPHRRPPLADRGRAGLDSRLGSLVRLASSGCGWLTLRRPWTHQLFGRNVMTVAPRSRKLSCPLAADP